MTPVRPNRFHPDVAAEVAKRLLDPVARSLCAKDAERPEILEQLADVLTGCSDWDGYSLAVNLDRRFCWDPDAELVEILDGASGIQWDVYRKRLKAWVKENGITTELKVGDKVKTDRSGEHVGEIVSVDPEVATATIFVAKLGHVRSGVGTHGVIVGYEQCEKVPEERLQ